MAKMLALAVRVCILDVELLVRLRLGEGARVQRVPGRYP